MPEDAPANNEEKPKSANLRTAVENSLKDLYNKNAEPIGMPKKF